MNRVIVSENTQRLKYVVTDWISSSVAFIIFNMCRFWVLETDENMLRYLCYPKLLLEECFLPFMMLGIYWLSGYYNQPFGKSRLQELLTTVSSALINTGWIYLTLLINDQTGDRIINYELILILFGLLFVFTYLGRYFITRNSRKHFKDHRWEFKVLIIGNSEIARCSARKLLAGPTRVGYKIMGYVEIPGEQQIHDSERIYDLDDIDKLCGALHVDQLIIAPEVYTEEKVLGLLYRLFHLNLPIKIAPDTYSYVTSAIKLKDIYGEPFVDLTTPTLSESSKNVKRLLDVVVSAIALILFSPVYAWIAVAVKFSSEGSIIYRQERIGLKQRPFYILKFRTMREDAEDGGPRLSEEHDPRITSVGKILRKYRLDELPQFWNVLKGEMSIVGPRPERAYFIERILKDAPYYALVFQVRPGITSWGMVKYGYASNVRQMVERSRYDLIYLSNMSLSVDMKILIYTVKTVVTGKGI